MTHDPVDPDVSPAPPPDVADLIELSDDPRHPFPEQIAAKISEAVAVGTLPPGTRLPSIRALAGLLGLAPGTVAKAYKKLEADGVVTSDNQGTRIAGSRTPEGDRGERVERLSEALRSTVVRGYHMGATRMELREAWRGALGSVYGPVSGPVSRPGDPDRLETATRSARLINQARRFFRERAPAGLVSAYVFGSTARGARHADSDVDIAVLLDRGLCPEARDRSRLRVRLSSDLVAALGSNDVDVVVLNDVPPGLACAVVLDGEALVVRDPEADHAFRRNVQLRRAELRPFLRRTSATKRRVLAR